MNCILSWINVSTIAFINFLSKLEWGTVADWVSGIGSLGAIIFAYWQMHMQRNKEKEDKKLANRPFFSLIKTFKVKNTKLHLWITDEDIDLEHTKHILGNINSHYTYFDDHIFAYEFKNVTQAVATNIALKVEYENIASDEALRTDYCNIRTCVVGNEQAIMLPHSIINGSNNYYFREKKISLFFTTIDDRAYCQSWVEKYDKSDTLCIEQVDIVEVPKEEVPNKGTCRLIIV